MTWKIIENHPPNNSVESHEDKIKQLLSDYSSSPLEKNGSKHQFFLENMAQGDKYQRALAR